MVMPQPRLSNEYMLRMARTPNSCFVCYRPSVFVLVSLNVPQYDFMYVCLSHVDDRAFATCIKPAPLDAKSNLTTSSLNPTQTPNVPPAAEGDGTAYPKSSSLLPATQHTYHLEQTANHTATHTSTTSKEPPIHAHYALHREFYAKRMRMFQPKTRTVPVFPEVPRS